MSLQLSFAEGTFVGKVIRTTSDHYASVYDVIRVAGVGREPAHVWNDLKTQIDDTNKKMFKFSGQGQRDTPVLNGKGVVKLLFLLPGTKARQFVAEGAEVLVRFLGGDATLIEELKANGDIASRNPESLQGFMRQQQPVTSDVNVFVTENDRQQLRQLTIDNDAKEVSVRKEELSLLDQYKAFATANISDPRMQERIQNDIVNCFVSRLENRAITSSTPPASHITIDEVATDHMHLRLSTNVKSRIGMEASRLFKERYPNDEAQRVPKYVNGEMRDVRAYPSEFLDDIKRLIERHSS